MTAPDIASPPRRILAPAPLAHFLLLVWPPGLLSAIATILGGATLPFFVSRDVNFGVAALVGLPFVAGGIIYLVVVFGRLRHERSLLCLGVTLGATVGGARRVRGRTKIEIILEGGRRATLHFQPRPLRPQVDGRWEVDTALAGRLMRFENAERAPLELIALVDPRGDDRVVLPQLLGARFEERP